MLVAITFQPYPQAQQFVESTTWFIIAFELFHALVQSTTSTYDHCPSSATQSMHAGLQNSE